MTWRRSLAAVTERTRLIFIDNPNNPTGTLISRQEFDRFLRSLPQSVIVVVDEAYVDFVEPAERIDILGYIDNYAEGIRRWSACVPFPRLLASPGCGWAFGVSARRGGGPAAPGCASPSTSTCPPRPGPLAALDDLEHYQRTLSGTAEGRAWLSAEGGPTGMHSLSLVAPIFTLIDVKGDATKLLPRPALHKGGDRALMKAVRLPEFHPITVGTAAENERFCRRPRRCLQDLGYVAAA